MSYNRYLLISLLEFLCFCFIATTRMEKKHICIALQKMLNSEGLQDIFTTIMLYGSNMELHHGSNTHRDTYTDDSVNK